MKTFAILSALALGSVTASPLTQDNATLDKRQAQGKSSKGLGGFNFGNLGKMLGEPEAIDLLTSLARALGANKNSGGNLATMTGMINKGYGKIAPSAGAVARRVEKPSKTSVAGAKSVKIRYGPYKVPNKNKKNLMGHNGMLFNYPDKNVDRPCTGDCTVLGISPGLEYADGSVANINTGLWLHHMILFTSGPGREDRTCNHRDISIPHAMIGMTPRNSERLFASGNERSNIVFPEFGVKDAGYKMRAADQFHFVLEFMNENVEDKAVYLTMTYDYVTGHPFKDDIRPLWFDVRQCGTSEVNPPKGKAQFTLDYTWTANFDGQLIGTGGHLHDGGVRTLLSVDGKQNCDSVAKYSETPEYVSKAAKSGGGHSHGATDHISSMHLCSASNSLPNAAVKKGQKWKLVAEYDFNQFKGVAHEGGEWDEVMGIQLVYVRVKGT